MSVERLELSTNGLKGRCSAIELHARSGVHSIMLPGLRQSAALPHIESYFGANR